MGKERLVPAIKPAKGGGLKQANHSTITTPKVKIDPTYQVWGKGEGTTSSIMGKKK